jgi:crotonobetainyl-CoA:carnitine CoA-transferase CaiB-like acyl-CoA transferase
VQNDEQWRSLLSVLGDHATRLRTPQLATAADRLRQHNAIDSVVESWTGLLSPEEVERRLKQAGIPAAAMRRGNDLTRVEEWRRVLRPLQNADGSSVKVVGLPFSFRGSAPVDALEAPRVGANGRDALRDWLELDEQEITKLLPEVSA